MGLFDYIRALPNIRPQADQDMVDSRLTPPQPTEVRPIEASVIDIIASLASIVIIETDLPVMKQPDKTTTISDWLRFLAWNSLVDGVFSLVAMKYAGEDNEYVIFFRQQ